MAPRRRGGGRAPHVCEKSDRATAQEFKLWAKEPIQDIFGPRGQNSSNGLWDRSCVAMCVPVEPRMAEDLWWTGSCQFGKAPIAGRLG